MNYKDFFISYSRKHSLLFAAKLHQKLQLKGNTVWFDKVNIPSGDDFQERIHGGIRDAQNFLFVMSPSSLTSPYCLSELTFAKKSGKRIFPLLHIEEGEISRYSEEEESIRSQVFEIIGKRDWIFAREKEINTAALDDWKEQYENHWNLHQDNAFLESWESPQIEIEAIDTLESVIEKLIINSKRHQRYVQDHTRILNQAYEWLQLGKPTSKLLVGKERQDAEKWLQQKFVGGELPPCEAIRLQAEFICTSKKNGNNLMTDVFLSYSIKDKKLMESVKEALERKGVTTWLHSFDIDKTKIYEKEIKKGIEEADNFLFFISIHSLESEWCLHELNHAFSLNKRVIPLQIESPTNYSLPQKLDNEEQLVRQLLRLQHIDFTDNRAGFADEHGKSDFELDMEEVFMELERDQEFYFQHKVLLSQALRWKQQPKPAFLLFGHNLENAVTWLRLHNNREENPPLEIHREFIETSDKSKGIYPTEVFISYSRKDADFARKLNQQLQNAGRITWFDQESIASGVDFDLEIFKGIERSFNFIFVITDDAVNSEFCERELEFAAKQQKRFVPLLLKQSAHYESKLPEAYKNTQWIDFENLEFGKAFHDLELLLDTDRAHVEGHVKWQQRAVEWKNNNQSTDLLLNKMACNLAESWMEKAQDKRPKLSILQEEFITASRNEINALEEKEKRVSKRLSSRLKLARIALAAAVILLAVAAFFIYKSDQQEKIATEQAEMAMESRRRADENTLLAQQKSEEAQKALAKSRVEKERADQKAQEAEIEREKANQALVSLELKSNELQKEKKKAELARDAAEARRLQADKARMEAEIAKEQTIVNQKKAWSLRIVSTTKDYLNQGKYSQAMQALIAAYDSLEKDGIAIPEALESTIIDANNSIAYFQSKILLNGKNIGKAEFFPYGSKLLLFDQQNLIINVMDMESGKETDIYRPDHDQFYTIPAVALDRNSTDEPPIILVGMDGEERSKVGIFDLEGNLLKHIAYKKNDYCNVLTVSPEGDTFLAGYISGEVILWDLDGNQLKKYNAHKYDVTSLAFVGEGDQFVSGSMDETAIHWEISGKKLNEYTVEAAEVGINSIASYDYDFVIGAGDYSVAYYEGGYLYQKEQLPNLGDNGVISVAFDQFSSKYAACTYDHLVVYEAYGGEIQQLYPVNGLFRSVCFSPSGELLVTGDKESVLWGNRSSMIKYDRQSAKAIVFNWKLEEILPLTAEEQMYLGLPKK